VALLIIRRGCFQVVLLCVFRISAAPSVTEVLKRPEEAGLTTLQSDDDRSGVPNASMESWMRE
jgi:hypothetical protein